jgi:hypothetical protein
MLGGNRDALSLPLYNEGNSVASISEQVLCILMPQVPDIVFSNLLDDVTTTQFSARG